MVTYYLNFNTINCKINKRKCIAGFVLKCLEIYNYNPHEVISAILDNNLSPILNDTPQDLIRIPPEPEPEQPILAYKGKKPDYKDAAQLLDDKTDYDDLKAYVLKSR